MHNTGKVTSRDAAARLGVDVRTLHRWTKAGRIAPLLKVPGYRGAYVFDVADVEALAAERATTKETPA